MSVDTAAPTATEAPEANRPIWQLVVGMAAFVGVLYLLGGWALPVVVLTILVIVICHEAGHYSTAKWTGMRVTQFFAGFGPRLWSKTVGETEYGIKLYPVGGFVKIPGMTMTEEVAPEFEERSYRASSFPRRVLVVSAGSVVHFLLAVTLAWALIAFVGQHEGAREQVASFPSWVGHGQTAAQSAGLRAGDVIVAVNGRPVTGTDEVITAVQGAAGKPVALTVRHGSSSRQVVVIPVDGRTITSVGDSSTLAPASGPAVGYIGVEFKNVPYWYHRLGPIAAIPAAFALVGHVTGAILSNLAHLFSPGGVSGIAHNVAHPGTSLSGSNVQSRPISLLGIIQMLLDDLRGNPGQFIGLLMLVNISFGLVNMLPVLPLDGGHVAIAVYERARTRRGATAYHADVNKFVPVSLLVFGFLALMTLSALYLDIVHPVGG
jgi:membrane-associated protease RseP (regulator of RpoE activity)